VALVLGLGNPGSRYARTRHNAGWCVVERLVRRWGACPGDEHPVWRAWRARPRLAGCPGGASVDLVTPLTFMNASGEALEVWRERHAFDPAACLVVVDDVYLPLGQLRLRASGSSGGHRGLESIEQVLGPDFARLRIGVGPAPDAEGLRDHVLEEFDEEERRTADEALERAADAVECWLAEGLIAAMNRFNRRTEDNES
jgi:PTH1 family peptidyl-tRNA hydrolase